MANGDTPTTLVIPPWVTKRLLPWLLAGGVAGGGSLGADHLNKRLDRIERMQEMILEIQMRTTPMEGPARGGDTE